MLNIWNFRYFRYYKRWEIFLFFLKEKGGKYVGKKNYSLSTKIEEAIKKIENLEAITKESVWMDVTRLKYSMPHTYWVTYVSYVGLICGVEGMWSCIYGIFTVEEHLLHSFNDINATVIFFKANCLCISVNEIQVGGLLFIGEVDINEKFFIIMRTWGRVLQRWRRLM